MAHDSSPGEEDDAVALVRVYCGLASADETVRATSGAASQLTVAVVDDAGRLLGVHEVGDDAIGYAHLGTMLVERTSGFTDVAVAADSDDHLVTSLLTAAGRPLVVADDDATDDFAERFSDDDSVEEMQAPPAARRAIGLARALQAGAIAAMPISAPRELSTYKPVLAAHVAMLNGRQSAAVTLREVLRELYPAALRAYPDPAHPLALAVLDALPEPGRLTARDADGDRVAQDVAVELIRAGAGTEDQITAAVTALVVAIGESPRRGGINKSLAPAAAETVRYAIGAVRSCDAACESMVATLAARSASAAGSAVGRRAVGTRHAQEPEPGTRTGGRRARPEPSVSGSAPVTPHPLTSPPVAPDPIMPPPIAPRPVTPPAAALPERTVMPGNRPVSVPPPPPGMTPIRPGARPTSPATPAESGEPFRPTLTNAAISSARAERQRTTIPPRPNTRNGATDYSVSLPGSASSLSGGIPSSAPPAAEPGSRANWPLLNTSDDNALQPSAASGGPAEGRVRPPWQDMPKEPPALRLVEPPANRSTSGELPQVSEPPSLRLVDDRTGRSTGRAAARRATLTALDRSTSPPVSDEGDGDLLIFAAARSAWFTGHDESANLDWTNPNDTGWRAAEKAASPSFGAETSAGLPKRVPQANLVPGSPLREERPLRIVRDAASIAAHTTGYFRGWRRGQEIGGYAIGGRPGREAAGGWDFSRDGQPEDYHHRNAGYHN
ncbi:transposase [Mangrovihabitans endophyticus]|uniref:Transposase n=1 Tax=Mangrovihabitans endophyticus TaxID=1751298 RepID=A0A8J3BYS8_9ACTN|nr:transposase [Mangrovihabitans endophyticus]GGK84110.1 hypothetical protein GCM10012284_17890 [Mangrovihabitans endophyticus]